MVNDAAMISRKPILDRIQLALSRNRVVVLAGPRQCGKTTLAREFLSSASENYFDLEDPIGLLRLGEPKTSLDPLRGLVVIDEVQRRPELFPLLRVLADREGSPAKFLILGSSSGELLRQSSESLAGRVARITIGGFSPNEVGAGAESDLWLRGGLPRSFLAESSDASYAWRKDYVQNLLERDFPQWGVRIPAMTMLRFWTMLAHYHGHIWNGAELARSLGIGVTTSHRYLDLMTDAFMVRQLQPWHANLGKRQVKSPKVYIRDSGLLHQILGLPTMASLQAHPKLGASWEGFVMEHVLQSEPHDQAYFWATHQGAEIDLVLVRAGALYGVEIKRVDAPTVTRSIRIAMEDLGLAGVAVVYPGSQRFRMDERVEAVPFSQVGNGLFAPPDSN